MPTLLNVERIAQDFLKRHSEASEIVMDESTGLPVKAVYSGVTKTGEMRTEPAVFWFDGSDLL